MHNVPNSIERKMNTYQVKLDIEKKVEKIG
mgnify:CR=1 FL=1